MPPDEQTELGLLQAAVRQDPSDGASRRRLVGHLAGQFRYSLHELPSGVLYGADGATPEQCEELERELEEFCRLVSADGSWPEFQELVRNCRFHFRAYRDCFLHRDRYDGYQQYLAGRQEDDRS